MTWNSLLSWTVQVVENYLRGRTRGFECEESRTINKVVWGS